LTFDVQDALVSESDPAFVRLGYPTGATPALSVPGLYWLQQPTKAFVTFNWFATDAVVPSVRINGGSWHDTAWPFDAQTFSWRTIAVPLPLGEIRPGSNTVEFKSATGLVVSNIDINLTAASPVP
jgi:hypothetical protein